MVGVKRIARHHMTPAEMHVYLETLFYVRIVGACGQVDGELRVVTRARTLAGWHRVVNGPILDIPLRPHVRIQRHRPPNGAIRFRWIVGLAYNVDPLCDITVVVSFIISRVSGRHAVSTCVRRLTCNALV